MAVQCDRGRRGGRHTGAWCTQATAVGGRGGLRPRPGRSRAGGRCVEFAGPAEASPLDCNLASRRRVGERPRPDPLPRTNEREVTAGPAEAGPGVRSRRSRTGHRPRPEVGTGSPCLGAYEGRQAPAPNGTGTTSLPRGGGRSRLPHRRVPRRNARRRTGGAGTDAVSNSRRGGDRAVAKDPARERRDRTQGAVRAQSPEGGRNLLAC